MSVRPKSATPASKDRVPVLDEESHQPIPHESNKASAHDALAKPLRTVTNGANAAWSEDMEEDGDEEQDIVPALPSKLYIRPKFSAWDDYLNSVRDEGFTTWKKEMMVKIPTMTTKENPDKGTQFSPPMPPMPLRSKTNKDFCAWGEYLDEERDDDFISWKKQMVGEGTTHMAGESTAGKENKNK